jgi:hypothetical protein
MGYLTWLLPVKDIFTNEVEFKSTPTILVVSLLGLIVIIGIFAYIHDRLHPKLDTKIGAKVTYKKTLIKQDKVELDNIKGESLLAIVMLTLFCIPYSITHYYSYHYFTCVVSIVAVILIIALIIMINSKVSKCK